MLIVSVRSKNDYSSYKKYIRHTDKKRRSASTAVTLGLLIACTAAVTAAFAVMGGNVFLYLVLTVDILCALGLVFIKAIAPRLEYKKLGKNFTALQTFDFYDNILELTVNVQGEQAVRSRIPYAKIVRVIDSPDAFYIYVAEDKALILNKSAMTAHECEKLLDFFKSKEIKLQ